MITLNCLRRKKDLLRRCVSDLIGVISEKLTVPIALFLYQEYPNLKIKKKYAIIECRPQYVT